MNKVLTISLNGNAFQLEEAAYDKLRAYLDAARAKLAGNPDIEEIMRDLEQAIADKINRYRSSYKSVASESDIEKVLGEMGPVDASEGEAAAGAATKPGGPKRLYKLREQGVLFGVCAGIAAYFDVDVTLVRVLTVAIAFVTSGGFILAYFIAAALIPSADTAAERQSAYGGTPVTAQEIIDRTMKQYRSAMDQYHTWSRETRAQKREWKRRYKQEQREWWRHQGYAYHRRGPGVVGELAQVLFLGLVIYLLYVYVPQVDPFFDKVWYLIHAGWSWIFTQISIHAH